MSFVVGTAGHIDHGKSTLITALTGIDPDRLAEEKRRGMTIDLGFAHMTLPSGREIGIVDVPGHARFMRNMLAGAHGLDAVLLVIAADEGVMPQTREHLEIIDLLDVKRGLIVVTKVDLVDGEWLGLVMTEIAQAVKDTTLAGARVVPVSAVSRQGLDALVEALDALLAQAESRPDLQRPRLPIDRAFTMSGFGTVVTGTLVDGMLRVGDEVEIAPSGRPARVRGLQSHNRAVDAAGPGSRVAANLSGVDKAQVARGDVLVHRHAVPSVRRADARIRVLASAHAPLRHGAELLLHTGTVEVGCRVIMLGADEIPPGGEGWVQLYLDRPIAALAQDRFVLRMPSPPATLAGGTFIDVAPRKHPRHDSAVRESLVRRAAGNVLQEELRKYPRGVAVSSLLKASTAQQDDLENLSARRIGEWIYSEDAWTALAARATGELEAYHAAHPLRSGIPREQLRSRLAVSPASFGPLVTGLIADGRAIELDGELAAPGHAVTLETDQGPASALLTLLREQRFAPASLADIMQRTGASEEMVRALSRRGDIVRVADDVAFSREGYDDAVALVKEIVATSGSVTVAQLRDRMGASRRPVLALLEYLDAQRVTRRVGDARMLR
ncbi:MAG TPA: selenocysteine-specific translation elongation factor [Candidatus Udaeobacter sp.]|nr:selenocysteine-specific translation elongation factor [Candidatus Udaeobacter sp.]